ncbi:hypothetical protein DYB25_001710 [Aphanomyces astaci]|uniref:Prokaryotic-type class I peptide chain release factors domain-containing protein n=1 Tax=Aphanomyces astaci TaxID=112090 RepID=A0A397DI23_APHAT|nr:hypothetical protein DYB36_004957 [Aphanomyces astaci]RHY15476.1 hypothetical protein DYB25_001710 [Aphanomyces astaci]RHY54910.1 hypothetical protein DYB34_005533 [Aphanomyces astaci]RHY65708.1 hypothetical protein DYB30_004467 [Aphanomyces astaci]RHZ08310.1 hypothetical protein DYB31_006365 [Aphanomyces astaci]
MLHVVRRASSLPGCRPTQTILRANETNGGHIVGTFRSRLSSSWGKVLTSKVVVIDENDLEEKFVKGSGNGGQKINKVRNSVFLKHTPTGVFVQCQKTRSLDDNRRVARKLLHAKLDDLVNGTTMQRLEFQFPAVPLHAEFDVVQRVPRDRMEVGHLVHKE